MTDFFNEVSQLADVTSRLTVLEAGAAIFLSFILTLCIAYLYKKTHTGARYSQSFVQTIIIMGVTVSVVMIVIGNNVAVAFGLVGAFSIIRFRSAMSDPKDIAFIFFGMAAGISCGLGFYILAILFTISLSVIILVLYLFDFGRGGSDKKRLSITVPENLHDETAFDGVLAAHYKYYALRSVETTNLGTMIQLVYIVQNKDGVQDKQVIDELRKMNGNLKVSVNYLNTEIY
ncbi:MULTISPECIES: DUF4956 domain-containing protein [unclassified Exiguobacterium]|uniref:DUF4956 domain-containing protein n=1 Tax=unclassified Exiguobacterium TaxID=2644629 RepID=UPI00103871E5|nr:MULTISPECIES: DUF4956 domain-containing protein [unclassified Exiguobacterium]TCI70187.1 DUF4956 domain-containing protein [Exiguobacterium sp. IPCI3]TCI79218.1 DUF4956 domain-containing protein [Exiguobacterium sp. IPCH1]TCI81694.1 DUF4956 domain-containing protein [Exiguobacterium sp. IPBC4]